MQRQFFGEVKERRQDLRGQYFHAVQPDKCDNSRAGGSCRSLPQPAFHGGYPLQYSDRNIPGDTLKAHYRQAFRDFGSEGSPAARWGGNDPPGFGHCPGGHHAAFRGTADMRRRNPRSGGA